MKTIDITPTWCGLMPTLLAVLQNPKASCESKDGITDELMRLAKIVDQHNAKANDDLNENEQLKHRLACIKKDMKLIVRHIQSECSGSFHQPSRDDDGNVYADQAWHNVSNVEIACDLNSEESLSWTP